VNARLLASALALCALSCTTTRGTPVAAPDAVEVAITAQPTSRDVKRLVVTVAADVDLTGDVVVFWTDDVATSARLASGRAKVKLPDPAAVVPTPPGPAPPSLAEARVELRGRTQRGTTTLVFGDDPAVAALRPAVAEAHAAALRAHREAWLGEHRAEVDALVSEATELVAAASALDYPIPRGRTTADLEALTALSARCLRVRPALERVERDAERVGGELFGDVPGLPPSLQDVASIARRRRDLGWACEKVTRGLEGAAEREAAVAAAGPERARLKKRSRTRRALASVALVDEILRAAATDELFLRYEDALTDWGDAETKVLRLRRGEPEESAAAVAAAAEAREDVNALNAMITLTLSGRSGQLSDAIFATAKRLKRLGEDEREAVLGLFSPELTPASRVLQQLVRDRL